MTGNTVLFKLFNTLWICRQGDFKCWPESKC